MVSAVLSFSDDCLSGERDLLSELFRAVFCNISYARIQAAVTLTRACWFGLGLDCVFLAQLAELFV